MRANRVECHEGAAADLRQALAWYQKQNFQVGEDFIEEPNRAAEVIRKTPERWPISSNNSCRPALALSIYHHLFTEAIDDHDLGCCTREPKT
jgi:hypothetical protein